MYRNILIIDDDEDDRAILADAIGEVSRESTVFRAIGGVEALDWLRSVKELPDLIFLDLNMPRMNGKEFLGKIKKEKIFKRIPVVIYSTSGRIEDIEAGKKAGAVHFLTKPVLFNEICRELSFLLSRKW